MQLRNFLYQHISWRILSLSLQFVVNILFARNFGPEISGNVFYVFTINAFIIQICGLSMESGIGFAGSGKKTDISKLAGFSGIWTILATAASYLVISGWLLVTQNVPAFPLFYSLAFISGNLLIAYANALFYARLKFIAPNLVAVFINAALITAAWLLTPGVELLPGVDFIALFFFSYLLQGVIMFVTLFLKGYLPSFTFNYRAEILPIIQFSLKAFLANLLFLGVSRVDYLFVRHFRSLEELGVYVQVSKIAQMFLLVPSMISAVLFPMMASGESGIDQSSIKKISGYLVLIYAICCTILISFGRDIFPWVYGEAYTGIYLPFILLVPGILAMSALYPFTAYFSARDNIRVNILGSLLAFLFICLANAVFVPRYGILAAAMCSSVGYMLYYAFVRMVFNRKNSAG